METARVHAACSLDLPAARRLAALSASLQRATRAAGWEADWVSPVALHVTLAALPSLDLGLLAPIARALEQVSAAQPAIRLELSGVELTPRHLSVRIAQGAEQVDALADALWSSLSTLGLERAQAQPPRVLLARIRRSASTLDAIHPAVGSLAGCTLAETVLYRGDQARPEVEPPAVARFSLSARRQA